MKTAKGLHPSNIHNQEYDFNALIKSYPPLADFVSLNQYDKLGVNFSNSEAVLCLNKSIILHHYNVKDFIIPKGHLCPPIPGRADYIYYIGDLLSEEFEGDIPVGTSIKGLDIGCGTSCIYPILGNSIYGWKFVGTDISSHAINNAKKILKSNPKLKKNIKLRFQEDSKDIFEGIFKEDEYFDFTMCNPPFYSSLEQANQATNRKIKNLNLNKQKKGHIPTKDMSSNFGGIKAELWCDGGELNFIKEIISQSEQFKDQCKWFTSLVSQQDNIVKLQQHLKTVSSTDARCIKMNQGNKIVHILAWKF